MSPKQRTSKRCNRCNRQGHLVKNCPIPRRKKERTREVILREENSETVPNGWEQTPENIHWRELERINEAFEQNLTPAQQAEERWHDRFEDVHFVFREYNEF